MRNLLAAAAAAIALAPAACNKSEQGGTPGTDQTFRLATNDGPGVHTHLKPGEKKTITVQVNRDSKFTEAVTLKADSQDKAIKADLAKTTAEASDKDITLNVEADKDAPAGDHIVKVTGKPKTGKDVSLDVKVIVDR